jgi:hypothetical protein
MARGEVKPLGPESCRTCHTPKRHAEFCFQDLWPRVEHKEKR